MNPITPKERQELWRKSKPGEAARVGDFPNMHPKLAAYEAEVRRLEELLNAR